MHIESRNYEIILACKDYLPLHYCNMNIIATLHSDTVSPVREDREFLKKFFCLHKLILSI